MKKHSQGPSLYYASDKNLFDALNEHKVDSPTIFGLFQRRNIVVSKKSSREDLARYFSRLTHDYYDHKNISDRLGVTPRRERVTSMDVKGISNIEALQASVDQIRQELENNGDVVQISRDGENLSMHIQYTKIDYKLNEFSQVQTRDGTIEFERCADGYTVRNTQNEYMGDVRDSLIGNIEKASDIPLEKVFVSLFDVTSPRLRSKFFHELVNTLPGYSLRDVTDVYVYKSRPEAEEDAEEESDSDTHIERVLLRGSGVTRSELLNELLDEENYYIIKIGWTALETMGAGHIYDIEAVFAQPKDCSGFSFILSGVFPREDGVVSSRKRSPTKSEIDSISRVVEARSRVLVEALRAEFSSLSAEAP